LSRDHLNHLCSIKGKIASRGKIDTIFFIWVTWKQGLKKCKFPEKLLEISRGPKVEDDRPFMAS